MHTPWPAYFEQLPTITLHDPLAELLGAPADGVIRYRYADAVMLAGHSCPTVASTWRLLQLALAELYGDGMPQRGGLEVALPGRPSEGTTGVEAGILTLVTGAAGEGGFGGIRSSFGRRRDLLRFGQALPEGARFGLRRRDSGEGVVAGIDRSAFPPAAADFPERLDRALAAPQDPDGRLALQEVWLPRVERVLGGPADWAVIRAWSG